MPNQYEFYMAIKIGFIFYPKNKFGLLNKATNQ